MDFAKLLKINITKINITKRGIQISLGLLWLLDGALQLQHQMFSNAFATQVIAPAGQGQPILVYGPINFEIHMLLMHPAIFDAFFAIIQLGIGLLILNRKTIKIGLLASVVWGLGVWYMGEGLGGLLSGHAMLLVGAPGAALIYAILALAVLPNTTKTKDGDSQRPAYWLALVWAGLWILGAIYQLLPGQNTAADVASAISSTAGGGSPGWLSSLAIHTSNFVNGKGVGFIIVFAALQLIIGLLVLAPGKARQIGVGLGIILSLIFWFVGQSLGTYFSGLATDPNSAPLFILLGVAVLGMKQQDYSLLNKKVSDFIKHVSDGIETEPVLNS